MSKKVVTYLSLSSIAIIIGMVIGSSIKNSMSSTIDANPVVQITPKTDDTRHNSAPKSPIKAPVNSIVKQQTPLDDITLIIQLVATKNVLEQTAGALRLTKSATPERINTLINTLQTVKDDPASMTISRVFYLRYANLDPPAAMAKFNQNIPQPSKAQRGVMYDMYHEWAWIDMTAALDYLLSSTSLEEQPWIIRYLLEDHHFSANQALLTLANNFSDKTRTLALRITHKQESVAQLFERILLMDIDETTRKRELQQLVKRWAKEDPLAALTRLMQLDNANRDNLLRLVLRSWASTNPDQALSSVIDLAMDSKYAENILSIMARTDGGKAMVLYQKYDQQLNLKVKDALMRSWVRSDPTAMAAFYEQNPGMKFASRHTVSLLAWNYTRKHPNEGFEWSLRTGLLNNKYLNQVLDAYVKDDLARATLRFEDLPPGNARNTLFASLFNEKAKQDLNSAQQWLASHKDEAGYNDALRQFYTTWGRSDPHAAAQSALSVENLESRSLMVSLIIYSWYEKAPEEVTKWILDTPKGTLRDHWLSTLVMLISRTDKQKAVQIAAQISDESIRTPIVNRLQENP